FIVLIDEALTACQTRPVRHFVTRARGPHGGGWAVLVQEMPRENATFSPCGHGESNENGHHLVGKKHSSPRQPQPVALFLQVARLHEGRQLFAVTAPHVNAVSHTKDVKTYAGRQPQAHKEGIAKPLSWRKAPNV